MLQTIRMIAVIVFMLCIIGCTGTRYLPPDTPVPGKPDRTMMYDLESSVQDLVKKMVGSEMFKKNYDAARSDKGRAVPVLCLGLLKNLTEDPAARSRLRAADDSLRIAIFETGLFEIKDDESSQELASRILRSADGMLEGSELVQIAGTHDAPDFYVTGDLKHFNDVGGIHTYRLHVAIHNLRTGKIVWEGIQTKVKL